MAKIQKDSIDSEVFSNEIEEETGLLRRSKRKRPTTRNIGGNGVVITFRKNKFEIQHRSACESTAAVAALTTETGGCRAGEQQNSNDHSSFSRTGGDAANLGRENEYFISETVLNCNKARWKAFTYHTKLNCFGSAVRVSATQVKERKMRACKYCVPEESTGEPIVVSQRRIISKLAAAEAERIAKVTKIVFGETQSKPKRQKLMKGKNASEKLLVPQVKLTYSSQGNSKTGASADFCFVQDADVGETTSNSLVESFNAADMLLDDESASRSDGSEFGIFGLEELSSTDPTSAEEPTSPWFATLSPTTGAEFNGLNVALPDSYALSPGYWGDGSTY